MKDKPIAPPKQASFNNYNMGLRSVYVTITVMFWVTSSHFSLIKSIAPGKIYLTASLVESMAPGTISLTASFAESRLPE